MGKVINIVVYVLVFVALTFALTRWHYRSQPTPQAIPDTVYVDKPYEIEVIKKVTKPLQVIKFKTDTVRIESVQHVRDTMIINDNIYYNDNFLTNYTQAPKFLGLKRHNPTLTLTYMNTEGEATAQKWTIGDDNYTIGLANGIPQLQRSRSSGWDFTQGVGAGYLVENDYEGLYLQYEVGLSWRGIGLEGSLNASKQSFGMIGVDYVF